MRILYVEDENLIPEKVKEYKEKNSLYLKQSYQLRRKEGT